MSDLGDRVADLGGAALGARLRRLSAVIDADAARIYAEEGIMFEQRWFGVVDQLHRNGPMAVGTLASALGISHPSVSQTRRSLEAKGLIHSTVDGRDHRRHVLALTPAGLALVERTEKLWRAFEVAALALDKEAGNVTTALDRLDEALSRCSLRDRIRNAMT